MTPFRYARPQVLVHWFAAAAILFLLATGTFLLAEMPNDARKVGSLMVHMGIGGAAALLVVVRIALRRRLPEPPAIAGARLARAGHMALNLAILLMAFSGMMLMVRSGAIGAVLGAGTLPEDFNAFLPRKVHGLVANVVMGLVALHVLAAIYHQWVLRDGLMGRMSFARR